MKTKPDISHQVEQYYPLSSVQRDILLDQLQHPELPLYTIGGHVKFTSPFEPELFEQALNQLIAKHDALRMVLTHKQDDDGLPMQRILPVLTLNHIFHDFSDHSDPQASALDWMQARFVEPFPLIESSLFRYDLVRIGLDCHYWLMQYHHIMNDGHALAVLYRDAITLYTQIVAGETPKLESPSYAQFIHYSQAQSSNEAANTRRQYWQQKFATPPQPLLQPRYQPLDGEERLSSDCVVVELPRTTYDAWHTAAKVHDATFFRLLLAAFYIYFTRTAQCDDLVIGFPILNRPEEAFKAMAGHCTLINPAWLHGRRDMQVTELLAHISQTIKNDLAHQPFPLTETHRILQESGEQAHTVIDLIISYQRFDYTTTDPFLTETHLLLTGYSETPLLVYVRDLNKHAPIRLEFVYNHAYFSTDEVEVFQRRLLHLLVNMVQSLEMPINQLPIMTPDEQQCLAQWNQTETKYPKNQTIVALFEAQVDRTPNNIAVVFETHQLTYRELNQYANQLAHALIALGVQANTLVGICVERSLEMVIGLLGILKAGGAYVPLDPDYPQERLQIMLKDSQVPVLLTQSWLKIRLPALISRVIYLNESKAFQHQPNHNPEQRSGAEDLAYVIYTSGTTGMPKGVMVAQQAFVLHCHAILLNYPVNQNEKILQFASFGFDASLEQLFIAWLSGASAILVKTNMLTALEILSFLNHHAITVVDFPPTYWQQLLEIETIAEKLAHLRILILGSEALPLSIAQRTRKYFPTLTCFNAYGPTEAVITPSVYHLPAVLPDDITSVSIGRPRANTRIYILNAQHQPQPLGIPGELCIAGAGLARGYLNHPKLTAEKFIEIKLFGKIERIYKTGDLARWLSDGNLEYLGRIDHQVKLRGFRIELGEIEAVLTQHEAVREAVVTLYEEADDNKRLVAYVTEDRNKEGLITELRAWLKNHLPDYMVPSQFMVLEQLPLTPGGKIDRKALPAPKIESLVSVKPITATEELLASLWSSVLKVETINRHDNFFELGGHSLLATRLVARVRDSFQVELPVHQLFESPILSDLAAWLEQQQQEGEVLPPIEPQSEGVALVMSYDQQAFWLRSQLDQQAVVHNMRYAVWLCGPLDLSAMRWAMQQLLERQTGLRLYFPDAETVAYSPVQDLLEFTDLSHLSETEQTVQLHQLIQQQITTPFDLRQGPLLRLQLVQIGQETHVLLLTLHHILGDAWSLAIWEREWQAFYLAQCELVTPKLPPLPIQYTDYAAWQRHYLSGGRWAKQEYYWLAQLQDVPELLQLPTDYPRPMQQQGYGSTYEINIAPELHQALRQMASQHNCTLFMVLFSAFNVLLYRFSGQTNLCIGVPMVNRHHAETQNLIGIFLNILPMCTRLDGAKTFTHLLEQVRHHSLEAQTHANLPFAHLLPKLKPTQQQCYNPYFQIMFNWATTPDDAQETSGQAKLRIEPFHDPLSEHERAISNLDIVVALTPTATGSINIRWLYDTALFKAETIELLVESYQHLLEQVVKQPEMFLKQFTLIGSQTSFYSLTSPQREIWFDQMLHEELPLYNIGGQVHLLGPLDIECFRQAVNLLIQKHDNLRLQLTKNRDEDSIPQQTIVMPFTIEVPLHDFRQESNPQETAQQWMLQRFIEPFVLEGEPLFRYDLIRVADEDYYGLIQYHHLIIDGYGVALLNRSLAGIYTQLVRGKTPNLDNPSYVNFIDDDRAYIESPTFDKQRQYWLDKYPVAPEPLLTPRYRSQYTGNFIGSSYEVLYLPRDFYNRLQQLAKRHGASLFHVLLGTLYVYFTRIAGRDDFAIGLPVLNRANAQFKQTAGLFTGISPTLFDFGRELTFAQLLQHINKTLKTNYRHQRFPVSEINRLVGLGVERSQLFDVNLSYENYDYDACFDKLDSYPTAMLHPWEHTPLMIFVRDFHAQADVKFDFVFNLAYFNAEDIKALQARFVTILEAILKDSFCPIHTLPVMTESERKQLIAWNDTATNYPLEKTIIDLFEQQVEKTPDNIAVVFEQQQLTYQQLNEQANQLAHHLLALKHQAALPDNPLIAIAVERSLEMSIGLLGILKAGGAYVPIDSSYPATRIQYLLEDSRAPLLLTQSHLKTQIPPLAHDCVVVYLDEAKFANQPTVNPKIQHQATDLAYVIYTSGSTGMPKGVAIEHSSSVVLIEWAHHVFHSAQLAGVLASTSICFDLSVFELFVPLSQGGGVIVVKDALQLPQINQTALPITLVNTVPSAATVLLNTYSIPTSVQVINLAGEPLKNQLVQNLYQTTSVQQIYNLYGPSEDTTYSTFSYVGRGTSTEPTIGCPIANTRIYILNDQHQPQPPGIPGELCIAGSGLARGYLNRPELTAEKFIEIELFGKIERIYKTGDLARWLLDGNLEYLGRIDHQIKLRGFRIELGEIEAVLTQYEAVKEAIVTLYEADDNKRLVAYVIEDRGQKTKDRNKETLITELRAWLTNRLPDYMVPTQFMILDKLPLTPNGKIDRKALPTPDSAWLGKRYKSPRNDTEQVIANIWQQVLKLEKVSVHDNFFEVGGHSLLIIQAYTLLSPTYPQLKVVDLFAYPTIDALAQYLIQKENIESNEGEQRGEKRRMRQSARKQRRNPLARELV
jgi:amino acid adenylation domain-containing protein